MNVRRCDDIAYNLLPDEAAALASQIGAIHESLHLHEHEAAHSRYSNQVSASILMPCFRAPPLDWAPH